MGKLFGLTNDRGLMGNIIVVFTSDLGNYLGYHWLGEKDLFHDQSVRVLLIVYDPRPKADVTRGIAARSRVLDVDDHPIDGAKIDVWQANEEGFCDVQRQGLQPEFHLHGFFRTGPDGSYRSRAGGPKFYPIPDDLDIDHDAVFGVKKCLVADFKQVNDPWKLAKMGFAGDHC